MDNKKLLDALRILGADDAEKGKPIDAFQSTPFARHTEQMRGAYEIGWRAAKRQLPQMKRRIAVLERALLIKAKREQLPVDVISPERRVERWIEDAEASMKPVDAEECI